MCGILGYITTSNKKPDLDQFKKALISCSSRGDDATGFYTPITGTVKKDIKADKFIEQFGDKLSKAVNSNILLAHCRSTTSGTEKNNENNHPHESERYVLIHNGGITKSKPPDGEELKSKCDSEIILSFVNKYGIKKGLEEMYEFDSMAIAIFDKKEKKLYLFRNSNPTSVCLDKKDKIIYFGSTSEILKNFVRYTTILGFKVTDNFSMFETDKDTLYTFSFENGCESFEEIKQKKYDWNEHRNEFGFHQNYSHYQNQDRMTWCDDCNKSVKIGGHDCIKDKQNQVVLGDKNYRRSIIYHMGQPRFIVNLVNNDAA